MPVLVLLHLVVAVGMVVAVVAVAAIVMGIELVGTPRRGVRGHPGGMSLPFDAFTQRGFMANRCATFSGQTILLGARSKS